jgi:hypothetical protein
MSNERKTCVSAADVGDGEPREQTLKTFIDAIFNPRPRCGAPATHRSPMGYQCEKHARASAEAAHSGKTIIGIYLAGTPLKSVDDMVSGWRDPVTRADRISLLYVEWALDAALITWLWLFGYASFAVGWAAGSVIGIVVRSRRHVRQRIR